MGLFKMEKKESYGLFKRTGKPVGLISGKITKLKKSKNEIGAFDYAARKLAVGLETGGYAVAKGVLATKKFVSNLPRKMSDQELTAYLKKKDK